MISLHGEFVTSPSPASSEPSGHGAWAGSATIPCPRPLAGAGPELLRIVGDLRKSMTPAEKVLWERLRNRQVKGFRFKRQHSLKDFIVDFFCYEAMLVVEVDGTVHFDVSQKERDEQRTMILKRLGIIEIRFINDQVINHTDNVI